MNNKKINRQTDGFVLLLTLVIVSIVLAIGLSLLHITLKQLTLSNLARESEIALHAANTGIECIQYHRSIPYTRQLLLNEDNQPDDTSAPLLECADNNPILSATNHDFDLANDELIYNYQYTHNVDSDKCVETSLYLLDASEGSNDVTHQALEGLDTIECEAGSICTVIFSRGFNRSCEDTDGLFTVQRELTIQY